MNELQSSGAKSPIIIEFTYILKTSNGDYYCGRTTNIERRMEEHRHEKYPKWFNSEERRKFELVLIFDGDCEEDIKSMGISRFYNTSRKIHNGKET